MQVGEKVKITKRTFLHNGIFIFTGSIVEIKDMQGENAVVIYHDREGHPHDLTFALSDLEPT
ncbi:hypothetical protein LPTSP4_13170 [Leptospira ryugenii]|uniref:Uncharacterized protein n=1 Tax=Leptospira ryugenii TaxID=1917863 RepID=A0A2P2DYU5_9LEPT|nr:hypothetical protein [Leptospira ryugenii]GBF49798.1 hypothetical protein LPTSP4_13170 [Leptospira ryugenii]